MGSFSDPIFTLQVSFGYPRPTVLSGPRLARAPPPSSCPPLPEITPSGEGFQPPLGSAGDARALRRAPKTLPATLLGITLRATSRGAGVLRGPGSALGKPRGRRAGLRRENPGGGARTPRDSALARTLPAENGPNGLHRLLVSPSRGPGKRRAGVSPSPTHTTCCFNPSSAPPAPRLPPRAPGPRRPPHPSFSTQPQFRLPTDREVGRSSPVPGPS